MKTYTRRTNEITEAGEKRCGYCRRVLPLTAFAASMVGGAMRYRSRCCECQEEISGTQKGAIRRKLARAEAGPLRCTRCGGLPTERDLGQPYQRDDGHYTRYGVELLCSHCHDEIWNDALLDDSRVWLALLDYCDADEPTPEYRLFSAAEMERWDRNLKALVESLTCRSMMQHNGTQEETCKQS